VGVNLRTGRPSEQAIAEAVHRVLGDPGFRLRARALQAEVAAAPGVAGVEAMVQDLVAARRRPV